MGTIYNNIEKALGPISVYNSFRRGDIGVEAYQLWIENESHQSPEVAVLNSDQLNLSGRFPRDKHEFVQRALSQCMAHDVVTGDQYNKEATEQAMARIDAGYKHDSLFTYIFPEESAFLYAVVNNEQPRRAAFLGSYYGYWAAAAKAAYPAMELTLVDINPLVTSQATRNFGDLGLEARTHFVTGDAEVHARSLRGLDLVILDAEGPRGDDDVPQDYRDKAIYYPHLKAVIDNMLPGSLLIAHVSNYLAFNPADCQC